MKIPRTGMNIVEKALEKNPQNAEAWKIKGDHLSVCTKFYEARRCYERAISIDQNYLEAWKNMGFISIMQNNVIDAVQYLNKVIYHDPHNSEAFRLRSHAFSKNFLKQINDSIEKACTLDPNNLNNLISKALHLMNQNNMIESLQEFKKALFIDSQNLISLINTDKIENSSVFKEYTIEFLRSKCKINSEDPNILKKYGDEFLINFDYNDADQCFAKINNIDPNSDTFNKRAIIAMINGNLDLALQYLDESLKLDPENSDSWTRKGEIHRRQNNISKSIDCFSIAIEKDNTNPEAWRRKGFSQNMRHKKIDDAIICLDQSLKIDPFHPMTWVQKALFLKRDRNQWEEAIRCLDKAISIVPTFVLAWEEKSDFHLATNDYESTLICFENILKFEPDNVKVWYNQGVTKAKYAELNYRLGSKSYEESHFSKSLVYFDKVLKYDPEDVNALLYKGKIFQKLGKKNNARQCLNDALILEPENKKISDQIRELESF